MTFTWTQILLAVLTFAGAKGLPALHHDHICPPPMSTPKDAAAFQIDAYQRLCLPPKLQPIPEDAPRLPDVIPIPDGKPVPVIPIPLGAPANVVPL